MYYFKNGINIGIPDNIQNLEEEWTNVKMNMSLILFPPIAEEIKERKAYDMTSWTEKRRRQTSRGIRAFYRMKRKTWRSPKKLK